jgi:hypothetical protein
MTLSILLSLLALASLALAIAQSVATEDDKRKRRVILGCGVALLVLAAAAEVVRQSSERASREEANQEAQRTAAERRQQFEVLSRGLTQATEILAQLSVSVQVDSASPTALDAATKTIQDNVDVLKNAIDSPSPTANLGDLKTAVDDVRTAAKTLASEAASAGDTSSTSSPVLPNTPVDPRKFSGTVVGHMFASGSDKLLSPTSSIDRATVTIYRWDRYEKSTVIGGCPEYAGKLVSTTTDSAGRFTAMLPYRESTFTVVICASGYRPAVTLANVLTGQRRYELLPARR